MGNEGTEPRPHGLQIAFHHKRLCRDCSFSYRLAQPVNRHAIPNGVISGGVQVSCGTSGAASCTQPSRSDGQGKGKLSISEKVSDEELSLERTIQSMTKLLPEASQGR